VGGETVEPLVSTDDDGVIVESVKLADDRSGDVVVRLYEALGARAATTVRLGFTATRADTVDLLERRIGVVELTGQEVAITLRPFQILTLRFGRKQ
jgi:alpha-mannosidase